MDADYANTLGTDETRRFIPDWTNVAGELLLIAIVGFSWDELKQFPGFEAEALFDPAVYADPNGVNVLIANMSVPVKDSGAAIGFVGCTIALSTIQAMAEQIKPFGDGSAFVFSAGGIIAAHSDPSRLGKNIRESEADTFGRFFDALVDAVAKGTSASFSYRPPQSKTAIQYYSAPFAADKRCGQPCEGDKRGKQRTDRGAYGRGVTV
ncbi:MAG: hypothetical protein LBL45_06675 [Treponema sp.]|jgi:methyl-accepting chemotaxis protein|nr:hypothetical protein [Treponema sp.]